MAITLTESAETILQLINTYGCMTLAQATELCDGDEEKAKRELSHLILINCAKEHDGIYVPVKDPKIDTRIIDAMWVAMDYSKDNDGKIDQEALKTSFPNNPVQISLILKNRFCNIVSLSQENLSSTLPFIMEKFAQSYPQAEKARGLEYIFAVRDMGTIKEIAEYAPAMKNRIALIEGDVLDKVSIRYLSPKKA